MLTRLSLLSGVLMFISGCIASQNASPETKMDAEKIVFWGDSITDSQMYPVYVEAFFRTRYPGSQHIFLERGWGGDQARNLERVRRDGMPEKADLVYIMLGMNDAGYSEDLRKRLPEFCSYLRKMTGLFREANPECRFVFMSPPTMEVYEKQEMQYYPWILRCYSLEMERIARELNMPFIDQNALYSGFAGAVANMFPAETLWRGAAPSPLQPFMLTRDGIHPNRAGQSVIAVNMFPRVPDMADIRYDGRTKQLIAAGAEISGMTVSPDGTRIRFTRKLANLPFALPEDILYMERLLGLSEKINRDLFRAVNLKPGLWRLSADGMVLRDFSADDLAEGINLSDFSFAPDMMQARKIVSLVEEKNRKEKQAWHQRIRNNPHLYPKSGVSVDPVSDPAYLRNQAKIKEMTDQIRKQAKPAAHQFTLEYRGKDTALPWSMRYQNTIRAVVKPPEIPQQGGPRQTSLNVMLENLTLKDQSIELYLEQNRKKQFLQALTLKKGISRRLVIPFMADPGNPRCFLHVFYQPVDRSFPRLHTECRIALATVLDVPERSLQELEKNNWSNAAEIRLGKNHLPKLVLRRWNGNADLSASAFLAWNRYALEIRIEVTDDVHFPAEKADSGAWTCDSVQLAFWILKRQGKSSQWVHFNESVFLDAAGEKHWMRNSARISPEADAKLANTITRKGTVSSYTLRIPWESLGITCPRNGEELHFNFGVNDRDSENGEWKYLPWTYGIWYSNAPAEYGKLRFIASEPQTPLKSE